MDESMKQQLVADLNSAVEFFERSASNLTEDDSDYAPVEGLFTTAQPHAAQTIDCNLTEDDSTMHRSKVFTTAQQVAHAESSPFLDHRLVHGRGLPPRRIRSGL